MAAGPTAISPTSTGNVNDVADFIRNLALELEQLSEDHDMNGVAACLRAVASEARRAKEQNRLVKLGLKPSRRPE